MSETLWKLKFMQDCHSKREIYFLLDNLNSKTQWDYWVFIQQELGTFNTANTRHNMKTMSLASLSLANV